jgi:CubicO group peptidase (beta-lactamase class C family)
VHDGKFYLVYAEEFTDLGDFVKKIAENPLYFEPGTNYKYGLNTAILGRLIEVVSGKAFYDFLKERIFDPLDMPNTDFDLTVEERKRFQPLFKLHDTTSGYYTREFDELSYQPESKVQLGGEGLVTTTTDYCHFCEMLLNNGVYNGKRILSPTSISWMHHPLTVGLVDGFKSGFTYFHLTDPLTDGALSPEGIFGWGGYHSTWFWIDQQNDLFGLIMTRRSGPGNFLMFQKFRIATYQALY